MRKLKRLSNPSSPAPTVEPSTGRSSVGQLPRLPSGTISATASPAKLSTIQPLSKNQPDKVLDLDIETVAAGFGDPDWVPQKITCVAWSWIGADLVESRICGPSGIFGQPNLRAEMLAPLVRAIREADVVTGHNLLRFDLPIVNAECLRLGLEPLEPVRVQDTIRIVRTKGFKKGQGNIARMLHLGDKMDMDWQAWQDAYDEDGWATIRARCESDVRQHKLVREGMRDRHWLKRERVWRP